MITLGSLRTALLSDQPYLRLDELVRAELAANRLTSHIQEEILAHVDALRETPGYGDDAEESLGDVLDQLAGFCPSWRAYRNPPVLPGESDLLLLPRWARVAFAARCARRVLPLYAEAKWRRKPTVGQVRLAVERAEVSAAKGRSEAIPREDYASTSPGAYQTDNPVDEAAHDAASAAAYAVADAADDARPVRSFFAMNNAAKAASTFSPIQRYIRDDYDHLTRLARWQKWTSDTPVSPDVFGPVWPEGVPPNWPTTVEPSVRDDLLVTLTARDGLVEVIPEDEAVNLFNALNAYSIARTGTRLTLEDLHTLLASLVPAEV